MTSLLNELIFLFAVIDPIGSVPVFIHAVGRVPPELRRAVAIRAVLISGGVLLFFIVLGQILLEAISIELAAFQAGGGVILFLFAVDMIFGSSKPEREVQEADNPDAALDVAVYPMAIPSIAGPGAILAVILLTDNHRTSLQQQTVTSLLVFVILAIVLACLLLADRIQRFIGEAGASIVSRIMGLIMAAVAAQAILAGVRDFFNLAPA